MTDAQLTDAHKEQTASVESFHVEYHKFVSLAEIATGGDPGPAATAARPGAPEPQRRTGAARRSG
jgi:hypothetical protein